jgi:hypothetical protein
VTEFHKVLLKGALLGSLVLMSSPAGAETRPVVVELFTSQGCSSCPPADALLGELAVRDDVIALGFHLTTGTDWLGRIRFPTRAPRTASRLFHLGEVYTPQMVVDGAREMVGSGQTCWPPCMTRGPIRPRR